MQLLGKIIIKGTIRVLTGLHVGGSKASLQIGGIDNNVIKTMQGKPYIPGSSLKGKLRSLLAKKSGTLFFSEDEKKKVLNQLEEDKEIEKKDILRKNQSKDKIDSLLKELEDQYKLNKQRLRLAKNDEDVNYIIELFGYSGDTKEKNQVGSTRLLVRDAHLINEEDKEVFPEENESEKYVISKFENVINRRTGTAEHPRQMERVPVGAAFGLELVYNVFDAEAEKVYLHLNQLLASLQLLQDDFIGGQGSRGYGQVEVSLDADQSVLRWMIDDLYEKIEQPWKIGDFDFTKFYNSLANF